VPFSSDDVTNMRQFIFINKEKSSHNFYRISISPVIIVSEAIDWHYYIFDNQLASE